MSLESIKKELASITNKKISLEKEIQAANAKYEAQLDILKQEFNITNPDDIDKTLKEMTEKAETLEKQIISSLEEMKKHTNNLEAILNAK